MKKGEKKMNSVMGFWSLVTILVYGIMMVLVIQVIYALFLAIKALKIYIKKNSNSLGDLLEDTIANIKSGKAS